MRSFRILLQRELWEHGSLRVIPVLLLLFVLLANLAFAYAMLRVDGSVTLNGIAYPLATLADEFSRMPATGQELLVNSTLLTTSVVINQIVLITMFFYLLDSLYGERRDRSILFWKSLPLSDGQIVFSKLATAALVVPIIILATATIASLLSLAIQTWTLTHSAVPAALLWQRADLFSLLLALLALQAQQTIWYLPVMGWLLLCSAWSRRAPILAAALLPALIVFIDSGFGLRSGASEIIIERLPLAIVSMHSESSHSLVSLNSIVQHGNSSANDLRQSLTVPDFTSMLAFISQTKVWAGIVMGLLFTALASWLRRWRDDSP
jgi:ABC-2 type transport system permease protein